jgi:hypothetical protein
MTWTADSYWAKAQGYVARANAREGAEERAFWASLAVELLLRSVLCRTHPALNADPKDENAILVACGVPAGSPKTIPMKAVIARLKKIHPEEFTDGLGRTCETFVLKRNEELHGDAAAFIGYAESEWLPGYATRLIASCKALRRPLRDLMPDDEAVAQVEAQARAAEASVRGRVQQAVVQATKRFEHLRLGPAQIDGAAAHAHEVAREEGGATLTCPACATQALLEGRTVTADPPRIQDWEVVLDRRLLAEHLQCFACGLVLKGVEQVLAAGLDPHFSVTTTMTYDEFISREENDGYENM